LGSSPLAVRLPPPRSRSTRARCAAHTAASAELDRAGPSLSASSAASSARRATRPLGARSRCRSANRCTTRGRRRPSGHDALGEVLPSSPASIACPAADERPTFANYSPGRQPSRLNLDLSVSEPIGDFSNSLSSSSAGSSSLRRSPPPRAIRLVRSSPLPTFSSLLSSRGAGGALQPVLPFSGAGVLLLLPLTSCAPGALRRPAAGVTQPPSLRADAPSHGARERGLQRSRGFAIRGAIRLRRLPAAADPSFESGSC